MTRPCRGRGIRIGCRNGRGDTMKNLPSAKSVPIRAFRRDENRTIRRTVARRQLCGLANDTKWDELIDAVRGRKGWKPRFRWKCVDGPVSWWDGDWSYHLPFPLKSVEWLDLSVTESITNNRLPQKTITTNHADWLEELALKIGFEYRKGREMIRIFGYAPRSLEVFDQV